MIIERLIRFYRDSYQGSTETMSQLWQIISSRDQVRLHGALMNGDIELVQAELDNMSMSGGLYGIDNPVPLSGKALESQLQLLGRFLGIIPLPNPEQPFPCEPQSALRDTIEKELGFSLHVPDCFGFRNDQGIPARLVYYLAAWQSVQCILGTREPHGSILEIGGGIGLLGYLAWLTGMKRYTVIDLPLVAVLNCYFASRYCQPEQIWLWGETDNPKAFAAYYPSTHLWLPDSRQYDVVFNSDSFPEITVAMQRQYLELIHGVIGLNGVFLSINHESGNGGQRRVYDACKEHGRFRLLHRAAWLMRDGYVEEWWARK